MRLALLYLLWLGGVSGRLFAAEGELCPGVRLVPPGEVSLNATETKLVCGDKQNPVWKDIPENQARFHLSTFLQTRGYHFPRYENEGNTLVVHLGEPTKVKTFSLEGEPPELSADRLRRVIGRTLRPGVLDEIKTRLVAQLTSSGYACPKVEMRGVASTGHLTAVVEPGPRQKIWSVKPEVVEGLDAEAMDRYRAFSIGGTYNADYLSVTTQRILEDGIVQSAYFSTECKEQGVALVQRFVPGPPRLVTIGVGVDTEQLFIVRGSWKHARLGRMASVLELMVSASFLEQSVGATKKWYFLSYPSRYYIQPSIQIKRRREADFERYEGKAQFAPGMTYDAHDWGFKTHVGPAFNFEHTVVGTGPDYSKFMSIAGEFHLRDHYFEYYRASPTTGAELKLETNFAGKNLLSPVSAQMFRLFFEKNWNLLSYDPPFMILSVRGALMTTLTDENVGSSELPTSFKHYLGGSTTVRGFGRLDLPGKNGALTAVYLGGEARLPDLLPWGLQPLVFVDVGKMGERPISLNSPLYYSPGAGIRWQLPFGVIRTTLARGMTGGAAGYGAVKDQWQFYFSFGEEF